MLDLTELAIVVNRENSNQHDKILSLSRKLLAYLKLECDVIKGTLASYDIEALATKSKIVSSPSFPDSTDAVIVDDSQTKQRNKDIKTSTFYLSAYQKAVTDIDTLVSTISSANKSSQKNLLQFFQSKHKPKVLPNDIGILLTESNHIWSKLNDLITLVQTTLTNLPQIRLPQSQQGDDKSNSSGSTIEILTKELSHRKTTLIVEAKFDEEITTLLHQFQRCDRIIGQSQQDTESLDPSPAAGTLAEQAPPATSPSRTTMSLSSSTASDALKNTPSQLNHNRLKFRRRSFTCR